MSASSSRSKRSPGGEVEAQAVVLGLEPGRTDAEDGPSTGQHVERRHLLGQEGGIAVGDPRHHGTQAGAAGTGGQATEECVGLEHRLVDLPIPGIWKRWSITHTESKPADSAVVAIDTTRSNKPSSSATSPAASP